MAGNVANNVLAWACGGLCIDSCRVAFDLKIEPDTGSMYYEKRGMPYPEREPRGILFPMKKTSGERMSLRGRWPANLILTRNPRILENFPITSNGGQNATSRTGKVKGGVTWGLGTETGKPTSFAGDSGSAARFFKQVKED
jgi:hypothetical protein